MRPDEPRIETLALTANGLRFHALAAGPADGPLVLLLHGFPELARSWRHQLPALGAAGYRAVAPPSDQDVGISRCPGEASPTRAHSVPNRPGACPRPVEADGPPERAVPLVSGLDCCYGPLTKQRQNSSMSPLARKCSLSSMWLRPPTMDL